MAILVNFKKMDDSKIEMRAIREKSMALWDEFDQTVRETPNDWRGSDAREFINQTLEKTTKLKNEFNECLADVENEIDRNSQKFEDTQKRNINMLNDMD